MMFIFHLPQTELSHNLQQLSEKARSTTEFIQRLKGMSDKVTVIRTFYLNHFFHLHLQSNRFQAFGKFMM